MLRRGSNTSTHGARWYEKAACFGSDLGMWFRRDDGPRPGGLRAARAICCTCPAIGQCLFDQVQFEGRGPRYTRFGIFGGTLPQTRYDHRGLLLRMNQQELAEWVLQRLRPASE